MELIINDRIRQRKIDFFNDFSLNLRYDSVGSTFALSFYFDPNNTEHKEVMCIGHYHICKVTHEGETLLTGIILSQKFISETGRKMVALTGYSLCGVLEDCEIPPSLYPLQMQGLNLRQIAQKLLSPFKLKLKVDGSVAGKASEVFEDVTAKESQTIKAFLSELATQKGIVLSHDADGNLLFTKADTTKKPELDFDFSDGTKPSPNMELSFNGQGMHSHITIIREADDEGGNAGEETVRNPYVINTVYRPKVIKQSAGKDNDTPESAKLKLAAELKNIQLKITLDRWDINDKIIKPNTMISVLNPEVYLYKKSLWFVEGVNYKGNHESSTCELTCVRPEVYNGQTPEYLWKGINLH